MKFAIGLFLILAGPCIGPIGTDVAYRNAEKQLAQTVSLDSVSMRKYYARLVRSFFPDRKVMLKVAFCESGFRHYDSKGHPLRGDENPHDIGILQINEELHGKKAASLGYNIYRAEGNLAYGRFLLETQGLRPWFLSQRCWSRLKKITFETTTTTKKNSVLDNRASKEASVLTGTGLF